MEGNREPLKDFDGSIVDIRIKLQCTHFKRLEVGNEANAVGQLCRLRKYRCVFEMEAAVLVSGLKGKREVSHSTCTRMPPLTATEK